MVNNAAYQQTQDRFEDISNEEWELTFRTNIFGYFYMAKAALKFMKEGSTIINCGSRTGLEGSKTLIDYAATKGAIHTFTKSLALNLAVKKIRVNCVAPGPIWTVLQPVSKSAAAVAEHGTTGIDHLLMYTGNCDLWHMTCYSSKSRNVEILVS